MYNNEERKLMEWKKQYGNMEVPDNIDDFIRSGIRKGKKRYVPPFLRFGMVAASILLLIFLTTIRVSPAFANYVSTIPVFERIVEIIRDNKGIMSAVENDYLQEIGITEYASGISMSIDAIIADEVRMIVFYTIESDRDWSNFHLENISLLTESGEEFDQYGVSYGSVGDLKRGEKVSGEIQFHYPDGKSIPENFILKTGIKENGTLIGEDFHFSVDVDVEKFSAIKKNIDISETIEVGGLFFQFDRMEIHPTQIALFLNYPESNSHEIFRFDDIALEDENGNRWVHDGQQFSEGNKRILYFQSNYFSEPEKLNLVFSSFTALPKEEVEVLVDLEAERFIKRPSDHRLKKVWVEKSQGDSNGLYFQVEVDNEHQDTFFSPFGFTITDAKGTVTEAEGITSAYPTRSNGISNNTDPVLHEHGLILDTENMVSPIRLIIQDYPSRIKEQVQLNIK
ncbi:DUF4179 domain-containing protein [Sutcliffiella horikoshii]|uniref:DUF4179 domain-containing protein n=1 Tax=Sutcliffiella horikoshii TaxID=79883 RepID=UPI0020402BE7|nr:DUF4179 domain-containing protein [Sutcliffiella horikoshii]MCM3616563.1 DUF4179 domain-containing protein [Sutcliffiella horikoshii]